MNRSQNNNLQLARILIGIVLILNVQSAIAFLLYPSVYVSSFELIGEVGEITMRGFGILFLMWNVPYVFAALHPVGNFRSLLEANIMQFIGLLGESMLFFTMQGTHVLLKGSILRFVIFDGVGLILLIIAGWLSHRLRTEPKLSENVMA